MARGGALPLVLILLCLLESIGAQSDPTPLSTRINSPLSPISYEIRVQPYYPGCNASESRMFTFDGTLELSFIAVSNASNITLNAVNLNLTVSSVSLNSSAGTTFQLTNIVYSPNLQQVTLIFSKPLPMAKVYHLNVKYTGLINPPDGRGLFRSPYRENGQTKYMIGTQFEPTRARKMVPSFDDPGMKAIFRVSIVHPTGTTALSNEIATGNTDLGNGWTLTQFRTTPKMSSYLLAIIIGDIVNVTAETAYGTTVRVWAWKEMTSYLPTALDQANRTLSFYGQYFNYPFPLPKCDLVAMPVFSSGAMENWGLAIFDFKDLLSNPAVQVPFKPLDNTLTITHELAHQWFGDLVTPVWWSDLFLNEGFAQYWMYVGAKHLLPDQTASLTQYFGLDEEAAALRADQNPGYSHPVVYAKGPAFDQITYRKGASLLRMLNYTMGQKNLETGLQIYLTDNAYRNADHNNLWNALTVVTKGMGIMDWNNQPLNVAKLMDPWVLQSDFPLLSITRSVAGGFVLITQTPFSIPARNGTKSQWYIPMWYRSASNTSLNIIWLEPNKTANISGLMPNDWIILNPQMRVFCRVNYDPLTWRMIGQQLVKNPKVFDVGTRMQLLRDSRYLSMTGSHNYALFMSLTQYLRKETEYGPWTSVVSEFSKMLEMFSTQSTVLNAYKQYLLSLVAPIYSTLASSSSVSQTSLQGVITSLACKLNLASCVTNASASFNQMLSSCKSSTNGTSWCSTIPTALRKSVYCTGIHWATSGPDWDTVYNLYLAEYKGQQFWKEEADNLLFGLTCTRNPESLFKLLTNVMNKTLPQAERALDYLGRNTGSFGSVLMWSFLEGHLQTIVNSGQLDKYLEAMVTTWSSPSDIDLLNGLRTRIPTNALSLLNSTITKVNSHKQWLGKNLGTIQNWLHINSPSHNNFYPTVEYDEIDEPKFGEV